MSDSLIIDVAIGLIFVFAVAAALTSAATEGIARFLGLRGDYLLRGIRSLVDGVATPAANPAVRPTPEPGAAPPAAPLPPVSAVLLGSPLLNSAGSMTSLPDVAGALDRKARRSLPSYISSSSFAAAVIDTLAPDQAGAATLEQLTPRINGLPAGVFKTSLQALAKNADGSVATFRASVASWYDDHMDRVSGWYKRHTRWISLAVGAVIVVLFNVNAVTIARDLYSDQALRESVITQALAKTHCSAGGAAACISDARQEIGKLSSTGLPLGWGEVSACRAPKVACSWIEKRGVWQQSSSTSANVYFLLSVIAGLLISIVAMTPGARFWFDLLSKLGSLRSTGPKPVPSRA